ncbi:hypothetical protein R6Q59_010049 [Mikania micrantha]
MSQDLFGGSRGWNASEWTSSDDRVRGGKSQSYLKIENETARFFGNLDIKTLGGAGFASQRIIDEDRSWDLSSSNAIELTVDPSHSDTKRYTFIVKDELLPKDPSTGREQSTISWEYDFEVSAGHSPKPLIPQHTIVIPYDRLEPTYRGRKTNPNRSLNLSNIRRMSIMNRSFFGDQQGDFTLCIVRISTLERQKSCVAPPHSICSTELEEIKGSTEDSRADQNHSIWVRLLHLCSRG